MKTLHLSRRSFLGAFAAGASAATGRAQPAGGIAINSQAIDAVTEAAMSVWSVPGACVGVVRHDKVHVTGYGVREAHYATVGAALLWTLEAGLGEAFTPAVRAAWTTAYGTLATVMIDAAQADAVGAETAA